MLDNATKYMTIEQHVTAVQAHYIFRCASFARSKKTAWKTKCKKQTTSNERRD
jgi:hypothetical protein